MGIANVDPSGFMSADAQLGIGGAIGAVGFGAFVYGTHGLTPSIAPWVNSGAAFSSASSAGSVATTGASTANVATSSGTFWQTLGQAYSNGLGNVMSMATSALRTASLPQYTKYGEARPMTSKSAQAMANRGGVPGAGRTSQALGTSPVGEETAHAAQNRPVMCDVRRARRANVWLR